MFLSKLWKFSSGFLTGKHQVHVFSSTILYYGVYNYMNIKSYVKIVLKQTCAPLFFPQESLLFIFVCNTCIALISPFKWHNRRTASCWSMMTNINNNVIDNICIVLWRFDFDTILFKIWFIWPYTIICPFYPIWDYIPTYIIYPIEI